jgi:SNF2 family DNA or RNA helicase
MIKPRRHQIAAMNFHRSNPYLGTFLWHGMGSGKTLETLWIAREHLAKLRQQGVVAPKFMVVIPKSAVPTWRKECHTNTPDLVKDMIIYPYSQLSKARNMLQYVDVRLLAFDESHYLKSPETNRVQSLSEFLTKLGTQGGCFVGGRILMLTGTPMPNGGHELYTTWAICASRNIAEAASRLVDEDRYKKWKVTFAAEKQTRWETRRGGTKFGTKHEGVNNTDKLMECMGPITHYVRTADCVDLPDKQEIHVDLALADDKLLKDADIEKPEAYMALLERLSRAKAPYLMEWVKEYLESNTEQLVIFSHYTAPIYELQKKYPKDLVIITGKETGAEREANIAAFQSGKVRAIAMSYKCGGESLNFQNCNVSVYAGWTWTDAGIKQAIARTHRSGQNKKTLHYFLTSGENDSRLLSLVRRKEEATSTVEALMYENNQPELGDFL